MLIAVPTLLVRSFAVLGLSFAAPALANGSIAVPEPSDALLFLLALVGLVVGRHSSRPPRRPPD